MNDVSWVPMADKEPHPELAKRTAAFLFSKMGDVTLEAPDNGQNYGRGLRADGLCIPGAEELFLNINHVSGYQESFSII